MCFSASLPNSMFDHHVGDSSKLAMVAVFVALLFKAVVSCRVQLFVNPWTAAHQTSLSLTISQSLPKIMFIASVMLSSHLIL